VLLDDQDRSLWDQGQIDEGHELLQRAIALRGRGTYVVQAAIGDLHIEEPRDWAEIAALYARLSALTHSPVVELNRAIAVAEVDGPQAGLDIIDGLPLGDYRYFHSTRADFLRRLGRNTEARLAYRRALELTDHIPERRYLEGRMDELSPRANSDWDDFWTYTLNDLKETLEENEELH
jgi:RNA polymerase sigma-70 factor (ECF subfamily)